MRIVLDTNILARANPRASGPARALLTMIRDSEDHCLVLSPWILEELERVLNYPRMQKLWPLQAREISDFSQALQDFSDMVFPDAGFPAVSSDPDDDFVIATAVGGRASVLCTLDRDLQTPAVLAYARRRGIEILSDVGLLHRLRSAHLV